MGEVINLRQARKARNRLTAQAQAATGGAQPHAEAIEA